MAKLQKQLPNINLQSLTGLLSGFLEAVKNSEVKQVEPDIKCSRCGMSYATFKKIGLLGCAHCYEEFREPLLQLLNRIHGNTQHAGRVPGGEDSSISVKLNIERLKQDLVRAIANEEYETAAGLRDRIRALSAQLTQPSPKEGS
jgi:protein arginine kinase activator